MEIPRPDGESTAEAQSLAARLKRFLTPNSGRYPLLAATGALLALFGAKLAIHQPGPAPLLAAAVGCVALVCALLGSRPSGPPHRLVFRVLAHLLAPAVLLAAAAATSDPGGEPLTALSPTLLLGLLLVVAPEPLLLGALVVALIPALALPFVAAPGAIWLNLCLGLMIAGGVRYFAETKPRPAEDEATQDPDQANPAELSQTQRLEAQLVESEAKAEEAQKRYDDLFENTPDMIISILPNGSIGALNQGFGSTTGLAAPEWIGKPVTELLHPSERDRAGDALTHVLRVGEPVTLETRFVSKSKAYLFGDLRLEPQTETGKIVGAKGIVRDVAQGERFARALHEIEERFALVAHGSNDGLWDWNIKTRRFYFSPRWKEMLGYKEEELTSSPDEWFHRVHPEDIHELRSAILRHLHGHAPHFEATYRIRHRDDSYRHMTSRGLAVRDSTGNAHRMVGSQTDITEFKLAEEQLTRDLARDPLTRLANRSCLLERLGASMERAEKDPDYRFALLVLNLDRFTLLNDSLGHEAGDQLLELAARRLESCVRGDDLVARLGGDEFAVLADGVRDEGHAVRIGERIHKGFKTSLQVRGQRVFVSAGVGVAMGRSDYRKPIDILRDATMALTRAKAAGKARLEIFNFEMRAQAVERLLMENDIRRAMKRGEFVVHYQPIVNLVSTEICGFEALLRWQHPDQGLIPPGEFLALAEETGLIVPLGWWVLETACHQTQVWQEQFVIRKPLAVSVNLSARNLTGEDAVEKVAQILERSRLDSAHLRLEIREDSILSKESGPPMKKLKEMGVAFYLDDFGKGLYPLSNLRTFPLDAAKIDCSFVGGLGQTPGSTQIVQAMVGLSHSLGLKVIAEGVETADQAAQLRLLRCELAQGFLYSKPLEAGAVDRLLSSLYGTRGGAQQCSLPVRAVPHGS